MAKKMRKAIAMILALSMCAPQMALQTLANNPEEQQSNPTMTVVFEEEKSESTTDEDTKETTTVEESVTISEGKDQDGNSVVETKEENSTTVTREDGSEVSKEENANTETVTTTPDSEITDNEWENKKEETNETIVTEEGENTTITNEGGSSSETKGQSQDVHTVTSNSDGSETVTDTSAGYEESRSEEHKTDTTVTTDVPMGEQFEEGSRAPEEKEDVKLTEEETNALKPNTPVDDQWKEGQIDHNDENIDWTEKEGSFEKGTELTPIEENSSSDNNLSNVELNDPLMQDKDNENGVTMEMQKPEEGKTETSVTVERQMSAEELEEALIAGEYPELYNSNMKGYTPKVTVENNQLVITIYKTEEKDSGEKPSEEIEETEESKETMSYSQKFVENQSYEERLGKEEIGEDNSVKQVVRIYDENNNPIGYREIIETTTVSEPVRIPIADASAADLEEQLKNVQSNTPAPKKNVGFTLPSEDSLPQAVEKQDNGDGTFTTIVVEKIIADSNIKNSEIGNYVNENDHIGYVISTLITDEDGFYVRQETREVYGTGYTETETTTLTPTDLETVTTRTEQKFNDVYTTEYTREVDVALTKTEVSKTIVVTDQDVYQLLNPKNSDSDDLYFIYNGTMYAVTGSNTITNSYDVATGDTVSVDPKDFDENGSDLRFEDEIVYDEYGNPRTVKDYYTGQTFTNANNSNWVHVGYGQFSDFTAWDNKGPHSMKHFMIQKGNEIRYVYCVELGAGIDPGTYYNPKAYEESYEEGNGKNYDNVKPWTGASGNVEELGIVALNGYYGTESGIGSLQAVKDLMTRNGYGDLAAYLTEGKALAATQLAIWEFGKPADREFNLGDNTLTFDDEAGGAPSKTDKQVIYTLRDLLINLAKNEGAYAGQGSSEVITKESITGTSITLKEKLVDSNTGEEIKDQSGNQMYNTDLSFKLDVSTSSINGDLVLKVLGANDQVIGKYRLAGQDGNSMFDTFMDGIFGSITPDSNGVYTLKNVQLAENVTVTLNLEGVQHLADGVYIYEGANEMQDFIGLSTIENKVDLSVQVKFSVEEPEFNHRKDHLEFSREDTMVYEANVKREDTQEVVTELKSEVTYVLEQHNLYGTVEKVETLEKVTWENKSWEEWSEYTLEKQNDDDGDDDEEEKEKEKEELTTIPDEDVPLSAAPRTGDPSMMLAMISLISIGGAAMIGRKKEDE